MIDHNHIQQSHYGGFRGCPACERIRPHTQTDVYALSARHEIAAEKDLRWR